MLKQKLKETIDAIKEAVDVTVKKENDSKYLLYHNSMGLQSPPAFTLFVRTGEATNEKGEVLITRNENDTKTIYLVIDIGVADAWATAAVSMCIMNHANLGLLEACLQKDDGTVAWGQAAYDAAAEYFENITDALEGGEAVLEDVSFSEETTSDIESPEGSDSDSSFDNWSRAAEKLKKKGVLH